jgi:prevent-host-death family protein
LTDARHGGNIELDANSVLSHEDDMINIGEDIQSLTEFKRDSAKMVRRLKKTRRPVVLTVNGKPAVVVQDAESYQRLLEIQEQYETRLAIDQALEDVREGRHRPASDVFAGLRAKHDLPER